LAELLFAVNLWSRRDSVSEAQMATGKEREETTTSREGRRGRRAERTRKTS